MAGAAYDEYATAGAAAYAGCAYATGPLTTPALAAATQAARITN